MGTSFAGISRRLGQIGIVPTLLGASLLAVVIAVTIVQAWTLRIVRQSEDQAAQVRLDVNLAVLKQELLHRGTNWRLADDGKLLLDGKVPDLDAVVDSIERMTHAVATVFAGDTRVATTVRRPDGSPATGTNLAAGPAREAVIDRKTSYRGSADILGLPYFTVYEPLLDPDGRQIGILFVGVPSADVQVILNKIILQSSVAALAVVLIVGLMSWLTMRASLRPLRALAGAVHTISDGQLDLSVPCLNRTDQLGAIGRAVETLREKAKYAHALDIKAAADHDAQARRQKAMDRLTHDFAKSVSGVLAGLMPSAEAMRGSAREMVNAAEQTRTDMAATTSDAEMSAQNLAKVAAAAEELTASVAEISRQVGETTKAAGEAVDQARATDTTVRGLSEAATEIGQIVSLISNIAAQTNLLALNATIEAARAGDAGKGFAVVAGEVKQLAAQTAQATQEISRKVSGIQAAAGEAADAVNGVTAAITRVSQGATTIAVAVEQQGLAIGEIAAQVNTVAQATDQAAHAMSNVSAAAERSGQISQTVSVSADQVTLISGTLRAEVDHFVTATRITQNSADRRKYERIPGGSATAALRCAAQGIVTAKLIDVSLGGAALACDWQCPPGTEVMLRLPGGGPEVFSRVVNVQNDMLGVAFRQDPETLAQVDQAIQWITTQSADSGRPLAA